MQPHDSAGREDEPVVLNVAYPSADRCKPVVFAVAVRAMCGVEAAIDCPGNVSTVDVALDSNQEVRVDHEVVTDLAAAKSAAPIMRETRLNCAGSEIGRGRINVAPGISTMSTYVETAPVIEHRCRLIGGRFGGQICSARELDSCSGAGGAY